MASNNKNMGVTRTYKYTEKDFRQEFSRVLQVLHTMNAYELSDWSQSITVLHHKNSENSSNLYLVTYPDHHIGVIKSSSSLQIIQGDRNLSKLIDSTQSFKIRQTYLLSGQILQIGDFIFKVGISSIANEMRCLMIEVEFIGTKYTSQATPSIIEFMSLLDPFEKYSIITVKYDEFFNINTQEFSQKMTAVDLLVCLNCLDF
jgi:hypothetical protein